MRVSLFRKILLVDEMSVHYMKPARQIMSIATDFVLILHTFRIVALDFLFCVICFHLFEIIFS